MIAKNTQAVKCGPFAAALHLVGLVDGMTAVLAEDLDDGDPRRVCGSTDHPAPVTPAMRRSTCADECPAAGSPYSRPRTRWTGRSRRTCRRSRTRYRAPCAASTTARYPAASTSASRSPTRNRQRYDERAVGGRHDRSTA
ncbi:hypothetical protein K8Z49_33395 [Actinomadura madurae]|uniref:hypothetical protein n=1 Tax=Actinomadura madurae TaxID=1993 RepID=UPI00399B56A9